MISKLIVIFYTAIIVICISGTPTCRPNNRNSRDIICSPGDDDYILKRGLISDSNQTTTVTLIDCKISDIDYEAFNALYNLRKIDLSHNKISTLKLGVIDDAEKLTDLDLSYNLITQFPLGLFDKKTNLRVLKLKGNRINNLELGIFDPLTKLKHLDLSDNDLLGTLLNPYIFDQSTQITFIDFSGNDMRETDDEMLHAFQALEFLNLERCLLTEVPSFATRDNLKTVKTLLLFKNLISRIDNKDTFIHLNSLENLNIESNVIKSVHEEVFKPLINLKILTLRNNEISRIPDTLFTNLRSLANIDMANNLITFVPVNAFRGTKVRNLNLAGNRFTYLTDNFCLELRNSGAFLQKFYFNQNPWQCVCLLDILKEVRKYGIEYNNVHYDGEHPVCVTLDKFCKRHDNFNEMYVDLYNKIVT